MMPLFGAIFIASIVGSVHCAGMCGGIVTLCAGMDQSPRSRMWMVPAIYNAGRLITYTILGAIAGAVGQTIDMGGAAAGLQRTALIIAGIGMIAIGFVSLLRAAGAKIGCARQPQWMQQLLARGFRAAHQRPPIVRAGIIGLLTGFLPCGWLYAFLIVAAGTGHFALGALAMATFWLGTLPIMLSLGLGLGALAGPLRKHVPTITSLAMVMIGIFTVFGRLSVPALAESTLRASTCRTEALIEQVQGLSSADMPCCHDHAESDE